MTDLPEPIEERLARRKVALELVGKPIRVDLARYLDSLKSAKEGDVRVIYEIETRESISKHSPETALEFVEKLAEKRRKERESNSARGVNGRYEMQNRLEEELDSNYETAIREAKSDLSEPVKEILQYAW